MHTTTAMLALASIALAATPARASCSFLKNEAIQSHSLTLPPRLEIPRDAAPGTVLYTSPLTAAYRGTGAGGAFATCREPTAMDRIAVAPLGPVSAGNQPYAIRTNLRGIGLRFFMVDGAGKRYGWGLDGRNPIGEFSDVWTWYRKGNSYWGVELVKTDEAIESGRLNAANIVGFLQLGNLRATMLTAPGTTVVTGYACTTPDVVVSLGSQKVSALPRIGSRAGMRDFDIAVNGCPPGVNAIRYELRAADGVLIDAQAVAALRPTAESASGLGIQITDRNGVPVTFGTLREVPDVRPGGGDFTIPLRASYYRTSPTITPGTADANVEFMMIYE